MNLVKDELIKEEILQSVQQLFQQYGLKKTTMEDIAKAMGKGKSTLYYYFCSKEEIFDAVIFREMIEVFNTTKLAVENAISAEDKLKTFTMSKIVALKQKINLYKIVSVDIIGNGHRIKHLHQEFIAQEVTLVTNILQFGINNGEFNQIIK
jgi:AcrR family transcriptional regulator